VGHYFLSNPHIYQEGNAAKRSFLSCAFVLCNCMDIWSYVHCTIWRCFAAYAHMFAQYNIVDWFSVHIWGKCIELKVHTLLSFTYLNKRHCVGIVYSVLFRLFSYLEWQQNKACVIYWEWRENGSDSNFIFSKVAFVWRMSRSLENTSSAALEFLSRLTFCCRFYLALSALCNELCFITGIHNIYAHYLH
jgi:hypothetical protein